MSNYRRISTHSSSVVAKLDTRSKPVEVNFFVPKAGFVQREKTTKIPLGDQFFWIAKLKAHSGKGDDLMKVILTHTAQCRT